MAPTSSLRLAPKDWAGHALVLSGMVAVPAVFDDRLHGRPTLAQCVRGD
jgi:hypothetical protein